MKVKLKSDFHDYYDHQFDLEGDIWERMSTTDMTRRQMLERMTAMGLYATGFPKAANLSKLADKRAGAEREVVGIKKLPKFKNGMWSRRRRKKKRS